MKKIQHTTMHIAVMSAKRRHAVYARPLAVSFYEKMNGLSKKFCFPSLQDYFMK
jgi:hypothetical protein